MEQIKKKKMLEKQRKEEAAKQKGLGTAAVDDIVVSTQELDIGDGYAPLDNNLPNNGVNDRIIPTSNAIPDPSSISEKVLATKKVSTSSSSSEHHSAATNGKTSTKITAFDQSSDDEEDQAGNYAIAGDVDVEDDWMSNNKENKDGSSDSESDENSEDSRSNSLVRNCLSICVCSSILFSKVFFLIHHSFPLKIIISFNIFFYRICINGFKKKLKLCYELLQ